MNPTLIASQRIGWESTARNVGLSNVHRINRRHWMLRRASQVDYERIFCGNLTAWYLETRDPTADKRIVEYCYAIPGEQFMRNGETKWLLRRAMDGILPEALLNERSRGRQGTTGPKQARRIAMPCSKRSPFQHDPLAAGFRGALAYLCPSWASRIAAPASPRFVVASLRFFARS